MGSSSQTQYECKTQNFAALIAHHNGTIANTEEIELQKSTRRPTGYRTHCSELDNHVTLPTDLLTSQHHMLQGPAMSYMYLCQLTVLTAPLFSL